jgi:hypothetical protein
MEMGMAKQARSTSSRKKSAGKSRKSASAKSRGKRSGGRSSGLLPNMEWLGSALSAPLVREAVAAALVAGAGAAAAILAKRRMSSEGAQEPDESAYQATPFGRSSALDDFT